MSACPASAHVARLAALLVAGIFLAPGSLAAAADDATYRWGSLPEADEKPLFDASARSLSADIDRWHERRNAAVKEQREISRDWMDSTRAAAENWFSASVEHPHYSSQVVGRLAIKRENRDELFRSWQFQQRSGDRAAAWKAELEYLDNERQIAYYEAHHEQLRANAFKAYPSQGSWLGIDADEFIEDTRSDLAYIVASHADNFLTSMTTCIRKSLAHSLRLGLAMKAAAGRWSAPLRVDGLYRDETSRLFDETRVWTTDGQVGCLEDVLRDSIINAWITTFRKQFVDRMVDRGVYPVVAEFWWEKAIWDTDEQRMASERISSQARLQMQAAQGFSKFWRLRFSSILVESWPPDRSTVFLQMQEEAKSQLRGQWADRIVAEGTEAARTSMRQQMGIWQYRTLGPDAAANARLAAQNHVKKAVEAQSQKQLTSKYENAALLVQQAVTGAQILFRESAFEKHEQELLKQYREIVECMRVLNRRDPTRFSPPGGETVKAMYANPESRRELIELCRQPEQREQRGEAPPPATSDEPAMSQAQCTTLRATYRAQCTAMVEPYRPENCKPPPGKTGAGYSGCWVDPRGCQGYGIDCALPCNASPQRLACGKAVLDKYIRCQKSCNDRLVGREFRAAHEGALICGQKCDDEVRADCKGCDAGRSPPPAAALAAAPATRAAQPAPPASRAGPAAQPAAPASRPGSAGVAAARIVNPNRDSRIERSSTGAVRITASPKEGGSDFGPGPNHNAPRLMQAVSGDWTVETRMRFTPTSMFQGAGILVCFGRTAESTECMRAIERQYYPNRSIVNSFGAQKPFAGGVTHLRLRKAGNEYISWYSADGRTWTVAGRYKEAREATYVGIMALRQPWDGKRELYTVAEFDYLRIMPN